MIARFSFICGCVAMPTFDDRDGMTVTATWGPRSKCHTLGEFISAAEVGRAAMANREWERAEAQWLEQD